MKTTTSKTPMGMWLIASLCTLSSFGYVVAACLEMLGFFHSPIGTAQRILYSLEISLMLTAAVCILRRASWGWVFCLGLFGTEAAFDTLNLTITGFTEVGILTVCLTVAMAGYIYGQRSYFTSRTHPVNAPLT